MMRLEDYYPDRPDLLAAAVGRFWRMVDKSAECWLWTGHTKTGGYGRLRVGRRSLGTRNMEGAHRIAYALAYGEGPDNLWVLHRCDNRRCVNPAHLFVGTMLENIQDMVTKRRNYTGGGPCGDAHPRAKVNAAIIPQIRSRHAAGESIAAIARAYGLSHGAASHIVHRRSWRHVPEAAA